MYGTDEYEDYDKLWKSTARAAGSERADGSDDESDDESDATLDGRLGIADSTTVLVILHHADFRETMLPATTWHMQPDDTTTGNELKRWVRWRIWETHWVWIDLTHMWLDLVSFQSKAHYPHDYKFVRQIKHSQQIMEVLHDYSCMPVIQVRRCSSSSRSANKRQRLTEPPN